MVGTVLAALALMAAPAAAYAGDPAVAGYEGPSEEIIEVQGGQGGQGGGSAGAQQAPLQATTRSGNLPFTGLDLVLLFVGGATLVGVGLGLRRLHGGRS